MIILLHGTVHKRFTVQPKFGNFRDNNIYLLTCIDGKLSTVFDIFLFSDDSNFHEVKTWGSRDNLQKIEKGFVKDLVLS